jgi:hypothetical protein
MICDKSVFILSICKGLIISLYILLISYILSLVCCVNLVLTYDLNIAWRKLFVNLYFTSNLCLIHLHLKWIAKMENYFIQITDETISTIIWRFNNDITFVLAYFSFY